MTWLPRILIRTTRPVIRAPRRFRGINPDHPVGVALLSATRPSRLAFLARVSRRMSDAGVDILTGSEARSPNSDAELVASIEMALDEGALMFLDILRNRDKDDRGEYRIDLKTRMEAFKMAKDWHAVRARSKKKGGDTGGKSGIDAYKDVLDKQARISLRNAVRATAKPPSGRRTKAQQRRDESARISGPKRVDATEIEAALRKLQSEPEIETQENT